MKEVTGRDDMIIRQALSIAIPVMLRYSLSSSNTMDMIRIVKEHGAGRYPDSAVKHFINTLINKAKHKLDQTPAIKLGVNTNPSTLDALK